MRAEGRGGPVGKPGERDCSGNSVLASSTKSPVLLSRSVSRSGGQRGLGPASEQVFPGVQQM